MLRIIAGSLKGRRLLTPKWDGLRPTSDKLRETLFNILALRVEDARVLDAYAGTGAIGIEALSRGAAHVTFVDHDPRALKLIGENLTLCGVSDRYVIIRARLSSKFRRHSHRKASILRCWIRPTTNLISRPRSWRLSLSSPPAGWWCSSMRGAVRRPIRPPVARPERQFRRQRAGVLRDASG